MRRTLDLLVAEKEFDAVYVHLFRMAQYVTDHRGIYRIADLTDVISQEIALSLPYRTAIWRMIYRLEMPRIRRCEVETANTCEETWLISARDREELRGRSGSSNIQVVPNGVEFDVFRPEPAARREKHVLFVGHLGVPHNVDAVQFLVDDIFPRVWQRMPECTLEIAGAGAGRRVLGLHRPPSVTVSGFVDDLNGALNRASVFVAPLRFSAGIQNKVLEAMAAGLPVITTRRVADGLEARDGSEVLVANEPDAIAEATVSLLRDPDIRARMGRAAAEFVRNRYQWDHLLKRCRYIDEELLR